MKNPTLENLIDASKTILDFVDNKNQLAILCCGVEDNGESSWPAIVTMTTRPDFLLDGTLESFPDELPQHVEMKEPGVYEVLVILKWHTDYWEVDAAHVLEFKNWEQIKKEGSTK